MPHILQDASTFVCYLSENFQRLSSIIQGDTKKTLTDFDPLFVALHPVFEGEKISQFKLQRSRRKRFRQQKFSKLLISREASTENIGARESKSCQT